MYSVSVVLRVWPCLTIEEQLFVKLIVYGGVCENVQFYILKNSLLKKERIANSVVKT